MAGYRAGLGGIAAPQYDRFAHWPRGLARIALALLATLAVLAAVAPGYAPPPPPAPATPPSLTQAVTPAAGHLQATATQATATQATAIQADDEQDLHLYHVINARLRAGDDYYRAAVEEQRRNNYPVTPGFTVRLPTLALLGAALGPIGMTLLRLVLFAAMMLAMWQRLGADPGAAERRPMAVALLMAGIASGLGVRYNVLHEVWAAQLMALSFALHNPAQGRWRASLGVAALALAVRELVLPYVILMAALATWRRAPAEARAWGGLILVFVLAMALHLHFAAAQVVAGDPGSPSWLSLKGIAGLLYKVNYSTFLRQLPLWLSGPCVVLTLLGWAGWRSPMGLCGFLLTAGYALAFMIVGRDNNFYWGLVITPLLFMGAAFVPMALPSLWRAAQLRPAGSRITHA